jgi:poly-gamma-glutamate synthesis protein (capsule biosynthesis protein)
MSLLLVLLLGCDPYRAWPDEQTVFPYVYTPETDLEDYEEVRWETETWDPADGGSEPALYLLKAVRHRPSAPVESLEHFDAMRAQVPALDPSGITLSFVGDAMWIADNHEAFAEPVSDLLDGDLRVGNLETPTSPNHPTELGSLGLYSFNAPPALLDGLPLDLVQVNNNHSLDTGDAGLEATLDELDARGIAHTGVDQHATVEVAGRRIAFLSYTWGLNERTVGSTHELFVVPFGHLTEDIDLSGIEDDIGVARDDGAQTVVLLVHWGFEYEYYPDPHFLILGRRLVALGADLVVGQGPHVAQPPELCHVNRPEVVPGVGTCSVRTPDDVPRTAAVLYSLGNFETIIATVPCKTGLIATVTLDEVVTGLGWTPVANVDTAAHELHPLDDLLHDPEWAEESTRLDAHLGRSWRRGGNR